MPSGVQLIPSPALWSGSGEPPLQLQNVPVQLGFSIQDMEYFTTVVDGGIHNEEQAVAFTLESIDYFATLVEEVQNEPAQVGFSIQDMEYFATLVQDSINSPIAVGFSFPDIEYFVGIVQNTQTEDQTQVNFSLQSIDYVTP